MQTVIPSNLVEVGQYFEAGYKPILDFRGWRVAVLRHGDDLEPEAMHQVERHNATNEVFILTAGQAVLIVFDGDERPTTHHEWPMELNVAYNIQQSVWHHVLMSPDAHIILVERTDTAAANSNYAELTPEVIKELQVYAKPFLPYGK